MCRKATMCIFGDGVRQHLSRSENAAYFELGIKPVTKEGVRVIWTGADVGECCSKPDILVVVDVIENNPWETGRTTHGKPERSPMGCMM